MKRHKKIVKLIPLQAGRFKVTYIFLVLILDFWKACKPTSF